jgi:hypothetical protein
MLIICHTNNIICRCLSHKGHLRSLCKGQGYSKYTLYVKQTLLIIVHVIHKVFHWLDAIQEASISFTGIVGSVTVISATLLLCFLGNLQSCIFQGFSVEGQENIQEILSKQLYLCQFLVAISILRPGTAVLAMMENRNRKNCTQST